MKITRPDETTFDTTHEDWHIAGHALHAKSLDEAVRYVASYRDEIERERAEVCICAAIRLSDGRVFRGHRHHDCIRSAIDRFRPEEWLPHMARDQGFVTSRNRYVDRAEGLRLQLEAGVPSANERDGYGSQLYSEDLY